MFIIFLNYLQEPTQTNAITCSYLSKVSRSPGSSAIVKVTRFVTGDGGEYDVEKAEIDPKLGDFLADKVKSQDLSRRVPVVTT